MLYLPILTNARLVDQLTFRDYDLFLLTDCESPEGGIQYLHVMMVHRLGERTPCGAVAAEVARNFQTGEPYLVLGTFQGGGHASRHNVPEIADLDTFKITAMQVVAGDFTGEKSALPPVDASFGGSEPPAPPAKKPWWKFW